MRHDSNQVSIYERPAIVDARRCAGDRDGDTVIGKGHRGTLVTLVERKLQYTLIRAERLSLTVTCRLPCSIFLLHTDAPGHPVYTVPQSLQHGFPLGLRIIGQESEQDQCKHQLGNAIVLPDPRNIWALQQ